MSRLASHFDHMARAIDDLVTDVVGDIPNLIDAVFDGIPGIPRMLLNPAYLRDGRQVGLSLRRRLRKGRQHATDVIAEGGKRRGIFGVLAAGRGDRRPSRGDCSSAAVTVRSWRCVFHRGTHHRPWSACRPTGDAHLQRRTRQLIGDEAQAQAAPLRGTVRR